MVHHNDPLLTKATNEACWNCKRTITSALPASRRYPQYCNPCGSAKESGDHLRFRLERIWAERN